MSHSNYISKENIDVLLKDFAENYKNISINKDKLEIILVGGASVILNYNFRDSTLFN